VYLSFLPYHTWALALLIGISALVMIIPGRPDDAATAAITTGLLIFPSSHRRDKGHIRRPAGWLRLPGGLYVP
jgi:hypothetical protein